DPRSTGLVARFHLLRHAVTGGGGHALLRGALCLARGALRLLESKGSARGAGAGRQIGIGDATGARMIKLGEQGAAGVGCDRGDRTGTRTGAEPVQCERSFAFAIKSHVPTSSSARRDT